MSLTLLTVAFVFLKNLFRSVPKLHGKYAQQIGLAFHAKRLLLCIVLTVVKLVRILFRRRNKKSEIEQNQIKFSISFLGCDDKGNMLRISLRRYPQDIKTKTEVAEVKILLRLSDGRILSKTDFARNETPFVEGKLVGNYITAGGLRISQVETLKTYRILYSGNLTRLDKEGLPKEHVKLRFWFKALADPVSRSVDFSPLLVAGAVAAEDNSWDGLFDFLQFPHDFIQQSGEVRGQVSLRSETFELILNGLREFKNTRLAFGGQFRLYCRSNDGIVVSLRADSWPHVLSHLVIGHVTYPNGFSYPVTWTDLHLANTTSLISDEMFLSFEAHGRLFTLTGWRVAPTRMLETMCPGGYEISPRAYDWEQSLWQFDVACDEQPVREAFGIIESCSQVKLHEIEDFKAKFDKLQVLTKSHPPPDVPETIPYCVTLLDPLCRLTSVAGGKTSKLADIISVCSSIPDSVVEVNVPDGFSVTAAAYAEHLKHNPRLQAVINRVRNMAIEPNLKEACLRVKYAFEASQLPAQVEDEIKAHLVKVFGPDTPEVAIRSSAVGEDGAEASGAGQMETLLGLQSDASIFQGIKRCWASYYSFRAAHYRRQMCRPDSDGARIAVLIQRLIRGKVSGILFTRHPDTGSVSQMIINASYGLGKDVVSGAIRPDNVTIHHDGSEINEVQVDIGDERDTPCLDEVEVSRLFQIGLFAERIFGGGRDIEFCIDETVVRRFMVLQARPITTVNMENEWELTHEFDSPLASSRECVTTVNVQEMMPGPISPLSSQVWLNAVSGAAAGLHSAILLYPKRRFAIARSQLLDYQHIFVNYTMASVSVVSEWQKAMMDFYFCGRKSGMSVEEFTRQNDMTSKALRASTIAANVFGHLLVPTSVPTADIDNFYPPHAYSAKTQFSAIQKAAPFLRDVIKTHMIITMKSSFYSTLLMRILDPSYEFGPDVHTDLATMLSHCGSVRSGEIPQLLQRIARSIKGDYEAEENFETMDRRAAAKWLQSDVSGEHGKLFRKLLSDHGHRCVRDVRLEFFAFSLRRLFLFQNQSDIMEKSWSEEPEKIVDALKALLPSGSVELPEPNRSVIMSPADAIASLKTPTNSWQKVLLRLVIPKARQYVTMREFSKSYSIKLFAKFRQAYSRLEALMLEEEFLPSRYLMYFLSHDEIEQLLSQRHPKLINKALRRLKFFHKFSSHAFDEFTFGHVCPITKSEKKPNKLSFVFKGTTVGAGSARGFARVVCSLEAANQIQPGDILIAPSTDVGWTPYFPLLSGLVTELGGICSHGAVVAREYGLPCLVGCRRITEMVTTGDIVVIDGVANEIRIED